jgi:hypothetical protein
MTQMVVLLIVIYHNLLRQVGKILGLLTAGLWIGFNEGCNAVKDMYKYIAYRKAAIQKQMKEDEDDG